MNRRYLFFDFVLVTTIILFSTPASLWGLSDAQYKEWRAQSPDFKQADEALNRTWKTLSDEQKAKLLSAHRAWLKNRDWEARKLAEEEGIPLVQVYAILTQERAMYIRAYSVLKEPVQKSAGVYSSGNGFLTVNVLDSERIEFFMSTYWPHHGCSGEIPLTEVRLKDGAAVFSNKRCPEIILRFKNEEIEVSEEKEPCQYHGLNCSFDGTYRRVP